MSADGASPTAEPVHRLTFDVVGMSRREAEDWGELAIDACRTDSAHITLIEVRFVGHDYSLEP